MHTQGIQTELVEIESGRITSSPDKLEYDTTLQQYVECVVACLDASE